MPPLRAPREEVRSNIHSHPTSVTSATASSVRISSSSVKSPRSGGKRSAYPEVLISALRTPSVLSKPDRREAVAQEIVASKDRIQKVLAKAGALGEEDVPRAHSFLNVLSVFATEIACQLKTWGRILEVIEVKHSPAPGHTLALTTCTTLC